MPRKNQIPLLPPNRPQVSLWICPATWLQSGCQASARATMSTELNPRSLLDLESRILRALCAAPPPPGSRATHDASVRAAILAKLHAHRWQHPEHRVVFEALTLLPRLQSATLREQLPAQATRMGFPDVNWDQYFASGTDNAAIETLLAELLATSQEERP